MTMDSASEEKTAYFISEGKKHFKRMPMGIKNAAPAFTQMIIVLEKNWKRRYQSDMPKYINIVIDIMRKFIKGEPVMHLAGLEAKTLTELESAMSSLTLAKEIANGNPGSACIIDDVIAFSHSVVSLLAYLIAMFEVFQHHSVTVKLRKTRFLPMRAEFVGYDLLAEGNAPSASKYGPIRALSPPKLFSDLRMIIGLLGFYQQWMPPFEPRITIWREYIKMRPRPGTSREEEHEALQQLWQPSDTTLLEELKQELIDGPILKRPDFRRRFYLKTDWSRKAMCAVVLQADCTETAEEAQRKEMEGSRRCDFDKKLSGLRLRPCHIVARTCKGNETEWHSATGELATGHYAMCHPQLQIYLWLKEFTWLTDCSGNIRDNDCKYPPKHVEARWAMDMMRFDYTIVHRPERMMFECNLLSRYNTWTSKAREEDSGNPQTISSLTLTEEPKTFLACLKTYLEPPQQNRTTSKAFLSIKPAWGKEEAGAEGTIRRTFMAEVTDRMRDIWILDAEMEMVTGAMETVGLEPRVSETSSEDAQWRIETNLPDLQKLWNKLQMNPMTSTEWVIAPKADHLLSSCEGILHKVVGALAQRGLRAVVMCFMSSSAPEYCDTWKEFIHDIRPDWTSHIVVLDNCKSGGVMNRKTHVIVSANRKMMESFSKSVGKMTSPSCNMKPLLDPPNSKYDDYISSSKVSESSNQSFGTAKTTRTATISDESNTIVRPVFDPDHPAPDIATENIGLRDWSFLIDTFDGDAAIMIRPVRFKEKCRIIGISEASADESAGYKAEMVDRHSKLTTPRATLEEVFANLYMSEVEGMDTETEALTNGLTHDWNEEVWNQVEQGQLESMEQYLDGETIAPSPLSFSSFTARVLNRWTTIPIPTDETWREEFRLDPDTAYMIQQIVNEHKVKYATLSEGNKSYFKQWTEGKLEVENGLLYQWEEPRATKIRQLRRRVVPKGLRRHIIVAYHATPLAGHVGIYKTYWRIVTRYWWPSLLRDVKEAVTTCAHCILGNNTKHQGQKVYKPIMTAEPFDIICLDIWHPGVTHTSKQRSEMDTNELKGGALLTSLCNTTSFATTAEISQVNSEEVRDKTFQQIMVPNGLPTLILIDQGSEFKGMLTSFCTELGIRFEVVSPEQHDGILCERFHRYLNKVMRIIGADRKGFDQWKQDRSFATYAWNAAPVDGTDIARSIPAKMRTFRFPLELQAEHEIEGRSLPVGEASLQHLETMFPLWYQQKELLKLLNEERRERHRELKNASRKQRIFQPGDIVIIRKQVTSNAILGRPEKLVLKAKGPYRIIDRVSEGRYRVQRLPAIQGLSGRKGKLMTESAIRMEKLPSTMVIHKRMDTMDTRLATMKEPLVHNPLEKNLGFFDFGRFTRANPDCDHAFEKIAALWNDEVENSDSSEEEDDEEGNSIPDYLEPGDVSTKTPDNLEPGIASERTDPAEKEKRPEKPTKKRGKQFPTRRPQSTRQRLDELWSEIGKSKDKLCLIRMADEKGKYEYHVVQIDLEETKESRAKRDGTYHARFWIRNFKDSETKKVRHCRFYPLVRELLKGGWPGAMIMVGPTQVEKFLDKNEEKYFWYQMEVNLLDHILTGPFDFMRDPMWTVPDEVWNTLMEKAADMEIDPSRMNCNRVDTIAMDKKRVSGKQQKSTRKKRKGDSGEHDG